MINEIKNYKKFFAEIFPDTDMIFIINIFGSEKDFAVKIARVAKSLGALTLGIPVSSEMVDEEDMHRFKDYSDAVIFSFDKNAADDISLMIVSGIMNLFIRSGNLDKAKNVLLNFTTGSETTLRDMFSAVGLVKDKLSSDTQVIWDHAVDENYKGVRVSLLAILDDNGYKDYEDMFRYESDENLVKFKDLGSVLIMFFGEML